MNRHDFNILIGGDLKTAEYLPVAFLLRARYGCAGYYNHSLNTDLTDTVVLINARMVEFENGPLPSGRPAIDDFNDFLQEIVHRLYKSERGEGAEQVDLADEYGQSIPLVAIPLNEISVVYPVAHIGTMMQRIGEEKPGKIPEFWDFNNKSIVLQILRTKLW